MDITDEQLLDFDKERLADWQPERAEHALRDENADLYRNHLAIALWIDGFAERLEDRGAVESETDFNQGYAKGIREIAAHLRQTDLLPEGVLLKEHFG